jgi:hypothetical protein
MSKNRPDQPSWQEFMNTHKRLHSWIDEHAEGGSAISKDELRAELQLYYGISAYYSPPMVKDLEHLANDFKDDEGIKEVLEGLLEEGRASLDDYAKKHPKPRD